MWPFAEFAVVFGLSLAILLVVIPAGTAERENFGLSPRMLPIVTASAIALFSIMTLLTDLLRSPRREPVETKGLRGVFLLLLATFAGVLAVDRIGMVAGGTALVVLASLATGVRRPVALAGMGAGALLVLLFVDWSGL